MEFWACDVDRLLGKIVDECTLNTDNCDANAACANTVGGFTCTCNPGFTGDGQDGNCTGRVFRLLLIYFYILEIQGPRVEILDH